MVNKTTNSVDVETNQKFPFGQGFVTNSNSSDQQVILNLADYYQLIEMIEDEGLYRAMQIEDDAETLSLEAAKSYLNE